MTYSPPVYGESHSWPVSYADYLAGRRRDAPYEVDLTLLRQVCALIDLVRNEGPASQFRHMAAWTRIDPDHVATLAVVLAAIAPDDAVEPGRVLELAAKHPVDLSAVTRQAHTLFVKYARQKLQHALPNWVWVANRIYDRAKHRARRARERAG